MTEWTKAHIYDAMPIENLGVGTRTYNALKRENIKTVGQIMDKTVAELLDIRNFGLGSLADLIDQMSAMGGKLDLAERVKELEERVRQLEDWKHKLTTSQWDRK